MELKDKDVPLQHRDDYDVTKLLRERHKGLWWKAVRIAAALGLILLVWLVFK